MSPLTAKGEKILAAMRKQYGAERGKRVYYASQQAKKITGTHKPRRKAKKKKKGR